MNLVIEKIKKINFLFLFLFSILSFSQVKILSWNVENLGKSKSDETIAYIAQTIKDYDVVALQEVVAGYGGAKAVARLADELNRTGTQWDYIVSNPTTGSSYKTERYAYLWKPSKVAKVGTAFLENHYSLEIDREPYFCTFNYQGKAFTLANFHAITKSKQPETEIKYFKFLPALYPDKKILFIGDFNCPQSHTVFNPLRKMGYLPAFVGQKTSLKQTCHYDQCLASEFDNIWYNSNQFSIQNPVAILFFKDFNNFTDAGKVTDHIPLALTLELK